MALGVGESLLMRRRRDVGSEVNVVLALAKETVAVRVMLEDAIRSRKASRGGGHCVSHSRVAYSLEHSTVILALRHDARHSGHSRLAPALNLTVVHCGHSEAFDTRVVAG